MTTEYTTEEKHPIAYRVARGGVWVALNSYWLFLAGFSANIILTRLLYPSDYGLFALAMFFAGFFRLSNKICVMKAFAQDKDTTAETVGTLFIMKFIMIGLTLVISFIIWPFLELAGYERIVGKLMVIVTVSLCFEDIGSLCAVILQKNLRVREISIVSSILFPLSYVPAFWMATRGYGVLSLVAQSLTLNITMLVAVWFLARKTLTPFLSGGIKFNLQIAKRYIRFGVFVGIAYFGAYLLMQLDNFLIGTFAGVAMLGYYERAYRIAVWPSHIFGDINARLTYYAYARLQNDRERLEKIVEMVVWILTTFALPFGMVMFIIAPDFIVLVYGERWAPASFFLRILAIFSLLAPLWNSAETFFFAIGKPQKVALWNYVQNGVLLAAGIPATIAWGAAGAGASVCLAFLVGIGIIYHNVKRELTIQIGRHIILPICAGMVVMAVFLIWNAADSMHPRTAPARMLVEAAGCLVLFYLILFVMKPGELREKIHTIWRLLRGKETIE